MCWSHRLDVLPSKIETHAEINVHIPAENEPRADSNGTLSPKFNKIIEDSNVASTIVVIFEGKSLHIEE